MTTLSPKQAEIQSRESRILDLALPLVARDGLAGLSMEAIAKQMAYAKGTIYNHFACKEEILLALAIKANEKRLELFKVATETQPHPRQMMSGIVLACEDFRVRFADLYDVDCIVRHVTVWKKASEQRREMMATCEHNCMTMVSQIGRLAVESGDLVLPPGQGVQSMMFGLWSLTYGGMVIADTSPGLDQIGIKDTFAAIRRNCNALMDGYNWQPLYEPESDHKFVRNVRAMLKRKVPDSATTGQVVDPKRNGA